jgi:hypothetical protein
MRSLHAIGGMCNRLRAILSRLTMYGELEVCWRTDQIVSFGHFEEIFQPIEGLTFRPDSSCAEESLHAHPDAAYGWEAIYTQLKPKDALLGRIARLKPDYDYSAVHIRRTDNHHVLNTLGLPQTTDGEFIEWIKKAPGPLYLATDNGVTQRRMLNACALIDKEVIVAETLLIDTGSEDKRYTSLDTAVVDLFMCGGSSYFMGSRFSSSFTNTINILRALSA